MAKRFGWVLGVFVLIASLVTNALFFQKIQKLEEAYLVIKVIDGDSIILKTDQTIRLGNMEAPELNNCGGKEARNRLKELTQGQTVTFDIFGFDRFHRPLALVYVGNKLVNEIMLKEGWGRYDGTPSAARNKFKAAYDNALAGKRGIFGFCRQDKPPKKNCLIKGNISRHDKSKTYHLPACSDYKQVMIEKDLGENWFCSEKEASAAGYMKAKNCGQ